MISFEEFDRDTPAEDHTNFLVSSRGTLHYPTNLNDAIKLVARFEMEAPQVQNVVIVRSFELLRESHLVYDGSGALSPLKRS